MRRTSSISAGAVYLDRDARIEALRAAVRRAAARLPAVRRVILFGSLVAGIPTPRSDADLLVVVSDSPHREPRDRVPELLRALSPLPCPLDLHVLTPEELERERREGNPLIREVLARGRDLL
jgi:predicted nucleotidyltransferase